MNDPLPLPLPLPLPRRRSSTPAHRLRRAVRTAARPGATAAVLTIALLPGLACGNNDRQVLERAATTSTTAGTTAPVTPPSGAPPATAPPATAATSPPPPEVPPGTFPTGAQLAITFTFAATGERVLNPYVAVWIEDATGTLVRTVALHVQSGEGTLYLQALRRWFQVSGTTPAQRDFPLSSPTRPPGEYAVVWDGTGADGTPVPNGRYFVCIEAVRDGGPHELIREPITIGLGPVQLGLPPAQELTAASVSLL